MITIRLRNCLVKTVFEGQSGLVDIWKSVCGIYERQKYKTAYPANGGPYIYPDSCDEIAIIKKIYVFYHYIGILSLLDNCLRTFRNSINDNTE